MVDAVAGDLESIGAGDGEAFLLAIVAGQLDVVAGHRDVVARPDADAGRGGIVGRVVVDRDVA